MSCYENETFEEGTRLFKKGLLMSEEDVIVAEEFDESW